MDKGLKIDTTEAAYAIYLNADGKVIGFEDMAKTPVREIDPINTASGPCGGGDEIGVGIMVPLAAVTCPPGYVVRCVAGRCYCVRA